MESHPGGEKKNFFENFRFSICLVSNEKLTLKVKERVGMVPYCFFSTFTFPYKEVF